MFKCCFIVVYVENKGDYVIFVGKLLLLLQGNDTYYKYFFVVFRMKVKIIVIYGKGVFM